MKQFNVQPVSGNLEQELKHKINFKTKPPGSLGRLEDIALQIGMIQNTLSPELKKPHIVVFAADHGISNEGVSAYPQEVTFQMVMNFLGGGAAINVLCKQNKIDLTVVDAGVNYEFPPVLNIIHSKTSKGTGNFLHGPAMSIEEAKKCIEKGAETVNIIFKKGCNVIGFGEMGIGNTSSASALMSVICNMPVEECVGKGTGIDDARLLRKIGIIKKAIEYNGRPETPLKTLAIYGGFEIAQMCGAILQAAENKMLVLVDGFIATTAFLVASEIYPSIAEYAIFCHQSHEAGHVKLLNYLNAQPLLHLGMRLGEGTGVATAYPLIEAAVNFLNNMASFKSAGVSNKEEKET
jgi:nicotinate-nucleotide--dimethylbenzimidazole phosphoribosyltransferase